MNMELRAPLRAQKSKVEIVDCDFHPKITIEQLRPFLSDRWWDHTRWPLGGQVTSAGRWPAPARRG